MVGTGGTKLSGLSTGSLDLLVIIFNSVGRSCGMKPSLIEFAMSGDNILFR